jgi:hypothetical protein
LSRDGVDPSQFSAEALPSAGSPKPPGRTSHLVILSAKDKFQIPIPQLEERSPKAVDHLPIATCLR